MKSEKEGLKMCLQWTIPPGGTVKIAAMHNCSDTDKFDRTEVSLKSQKDSGFRFNIAPVITVLYHDPVNQVQNNIDSQWHSVHWDLIFGR